MKEKMDKFLGAFPLLTKEEADLNEDVLKWDDEEKAAFLFAKKIFEEEGEKEATSIDDEERNG